MANIESLELLILQEIYLHLFLMIGIQTWLTLLLKLNNMILYFENGTI